MNNSQIRVQGVAELLDVVPHLLGYAPSVPSVVVLAFGQSSGGGAGLVGGSHVPVPPADLIAADAAFVINGMHHGPAPVDGLMLVEYVNAYGDTDTLTAALESGCESGGLRLLGRVMVRGSEWLHIDSGESGVLTPSAAGAALAVSGSAPLPSRDALTESLSAGPAASATAEAIKARGETPTVEAFAQAWAFLLGALGEVPVSEVPADVIAAGVLGLAETSWRDTLLGHITPSGLFPAEIVAGDSLSAIEAVLPREAGGWSEPTAVCRRLLSLVPMIPDEYIAGPGTLATIAAWAAGDHASARDLVARVLRSSPDYTMAQLMDMTLSLTLTPHDLIGRTADGEQS